MDSIISTFHIDWKIIIAQAINFGIVFFILYVYALKPLSKLMEERGEKINQGIKDAKTNALLLVKATQEYEQNTIKLRQLSIDAQKELQKDLEKLKAENLEKIKADNDEWMKKRQKQLEADKIALVESAKSEVMSIAMLAAEKIIKSKQDMNNL